MNSSRPHLPERPNVIWIFGDQHRAQALGCAGDPNLSTPNLDRLAAEGIYVPNAVSTCPLCCPARGTLLTGKYPHACVPGHEHALPLDQPTLAQPFREGGYYTAYFGKWHLGGFHEREGRATFFETSREARGGFDTWVGYENNNSQWDCWVHGHRDEAEVPLQPVEGYETDGLTDLLIGFLEERASSAGTKQEAAPFFAALSVQPPHDPYLAPAEWMERHSPANVELRSNVPEIPRVVDQARRELAGYYAMIENLDWNIGRIRAALEETGLANDTYLVFFSDHGDMMGSHGQFRKLSPWEESVRVPLIIAGGALTYYHKSGIVDAPVGLVDVAPTTLGLCGIDVPDWMQGTDYSGLRLKEKETKIPESAFIQSVIPTGHGHSIDRPWRCVVTRDGWKYACLEGQPWMLFNLNEDPFEQANLALNSAFGRKRAELQAILRRHIENNGDSFPLPEGIE